MRQIITAIAVYCILNLFVPKLWEMLVSSAPKPVVNLVTFCAALVCLGFVICAPAIWQRLSDPAGYPVSSTLFIIGLAAAVIGAAWWQLVVPNCTAKFSQRLEVQALLVDEPYPDDTDFAGIKWLSIDSDVRLNFLSRGVLPIQNLDVIVSFDGAQIKAIGNIDKYPGVSTIPLNTSGAPDALWLTTSENAAIPSQPTFQDSYRIRCEKVLDSTTLHLAIAVLCIGRPPDDTSNDPLPKKLVRHKPSVIHIKGSYDTTSRNGVETHPIDFNYAFPASN